MPALITAEGPLRLELVGDPAQFGGHFNSVSWKRAMISNCTRITQLCFVASMLAAGVLLTNAAVARDGVTGCSIAEIETDQGPVWRHTIEVQVPEGGYCRVYIGEDKDRKSWKYCWLKRSPDNPVSGTCDDPVDDKVFDGWKAKAVCGGQNFMAYCRREIPLAPSSH